MAGILDKCKKRRCYPVDLGDGDKIFVRALTNDEIDRVQAIDTDIAIPLIIGLGLVDESRSQVLPLVSPETENEWAIRLRTELKDMPADTTNQLVESIRRVSRAQPVEEIAKN